MKKEKHPVYRAVMAGLVALLLIGILLLVMGLMLGPNRVFASPPVAL